MGVGDAGEVGEARLVTEGSYTGTGFRGVLRSFFFGVGVALDGGEVGEGGYEVCWDIPFRFVASSDGRLSRLSLSRLPTPEYPAPAPITSSLDPAPRLCFDEFMVMTVDERRL